MNISNQPNLHEPTLDMMLIMKIGEFGPSIEINEEGRWVVTLVTDFLGGVPLYERYEVADIDVLIIFRHNTEIVKIKAALLQSKRLYAHESSISEAHFYRESHYHFIENEIPSLNTQRIFSYTEDSKYKSLSNDSQIKQ